MGLGFSFKGGAPAADITIARRAKSRIASHVMILERLLDRRERAVGIGHALDRHHLGALQIGGQRRAIS